MARLAFACALLITIVATATGSPVGAVTPAQDMPAGPGKDTMVRLCKNCHPLDRVLASRHTNKEWISVVEKMLTQGAEGSIDELNEAIDYLTDQYGKPVAINTATATEIVDGLGILEEDAAKIVAYRTGHPKFASWKDVAAVPGIDAPLIERRQKNFTFTPGSGYGIATVTGRPRPMDGR